MRLSKAQLSELESLAAEASQHRDDLGSHVLNLTDRLFPAEAKFLAACAAHVEALVAEVTERRAAHARECPDYQHCDVHCPGEQ